MLVHFSPVIAFVHILLDVLVAVVAIRMRLCAFCNIVFCHWCMLIVVFLKIFELLLLLFSTTIMPPKRDPRRPAEEKSVEHSLAT